MRHCINCGSKLGTERFCTNCGTDNGKVPQKIYNDSSVNRAELMNGLDLSVVLRFGAVILFAIAVLTMLITCCSSAASIIASSMLYRFGLIFVVIYFVIGMWSVIPALLFCLDIKKDNSKAVISSAITVIVLMIIMAIIKAIAANFTGSLYLLYNIVFPYVNKMATIIVFCLLAIATGFISMYKKQ